MRTREDEDVGSIPGGLRVDIVWKLRCEPRLPVKIPAVRRRVGPRNARRIFRAHKARCLPQTDRDGRWHLERSDNDAANGRDHSQCLKSGDPLLQKDDGQCDSDY